MPGKRNEAGGLQAPQFRGNRAAIRKPFTGKEMGWMSRLGSNPLRAGPFIERRIASSVTKTAVFVVKFHFPACKRPKGVVESVPRGLPDASRCG